MIQTHIEFPSGEDLDNFVAHVNPFVLERTVTTVFGVFTEKQLELAKNGFNAIVHCEC